MPVDKNCGVQIERLRVCAGLVNDAVGQSGGSPAVNAAAAPAAAPIQVGVKMGPLTSTRTLQCESLLGNDAGYPIFVYP